MKISEADCSLFTNANNARVMGNAFFDNCNLSVLSGYTRILAGGGKTEGLVVAPVQA